MKWLWVWLMVLLLAGCLSGPAKFTIPDEPKYRDMKIYPVEGGVCMGNEDWAILGGNVNLLKGYADSLRKLLEGMQQGK